MENTLLHILQIPVMMLLIEVCVKLGLIQNVGRYFPTFRKKTKHHHPEVQQLSRTHTLLEMHLNKLYNFEVLLI